MLLKLNIAIILTSYSLLSSVSTLPPGAPPAGYGGDVSLVSTTTAAVKIESTSTVTELEETTTVELPTTSNIETTTTESTAPAETSNSSQELTAEAAEATSLAEPTKTEEQLTDNSSTSEPTISTIEDVKTTELPAASDEEETTDLPSNQNTELPENNQESNAPVSTPNENSSENIGNAPVIDPKYGTNEQPELGNENGNVEIIQPKYNGGEKNEGANESVVIQPKYVPTYNGATENAKTSSGRKMYKCRSKNGKPPKTIKVTGGDNNIYSQSPNQNIDVSQQPTQNNNEIESDETPNQGLELPTEVELPPVAKEVSDILKNVNGKINFPDFIKTCKEVVPSEFDFEKFVELMMEFKPELTFQEFADAIGEAGIANLDDFDANNILKNFGGELDRSVILNVMGSLGSSLKSLNLDPSKAAKLLSQIKI
ncbi:hypothetical protein HDU92_004279 [Lobulomyces angularis]|nr:hypothetical protein HDU92_004279 [Lobulomyces angularis]